MHAEYTDGFVSAEDELACRAHLDECSACAGYDVQVRRSLLALQVLPRIEPSAGFREGWLKRLARERLSFTPPRPLGVRWAVAGAILAASAAVLIAGLKGTRPLEPARHVPAFALAAERTTEMGPNATAAGSVLFAERTVSLPAVDSATISARFEGLPGQVPLRAAPSARQGSAVRLQTVSYPGQ